MNIAGLTASNISSTVWSQATRSLTVDPATDAGCATLVWARAVRSLTKMGYATITTAGNQSLAHNATFLFQPAAGQFMLLSLGVSLPAGGAGNVTIELFDGTNVFIMATIAPAASGFVANVLCGNQFTVRLNNSNNTNACTYGVNQALFTT